MVSMATAPGPLDRTAPKQSSLEARLPVPGEETYTAAYPSVWMAKPVVDDVHLLDVHLLGGCACANRPPDRNSPSQPPSG
jgi:hypothetical protein